MDRPNWLRQKKIRSGTRPLGIVGAQQEASKKERIPPGEPQLDRTGIAYDSIASRAMFKARLAHKIFNVAGWPAKGRLSTVTPSGVARAI